jgi:polyphosphate kinase 2
LADDKGKKKAKDPAASAAGAGGPGALAAAHADKAVTSKKLDREAYEHELERLQVELVKMQEWVKKEGRRVAVVFEGRDAAGKGGTIKRIAEHLNPRVVRIAALASPSDREKTEWYFQRYVAELPAAGEVVLFDRSWYNRAGVERVMGFATEDQVWEFFRTCPEFERMLMRDGLTLLKYWFSVSDEEQEKRFQQRLKSPLNIWKLSPMDLESRMRWVEYSQAKDEMFSYTDTKDSPWWVVNADDKRRARLNMIHHLLSMIPYEDVVPHDMDLPPRPPDKGYVRPPIESQTFIPEVY